MGLKLFCQSCTMPIDNIADRGNEKDRLLSSEYCKYCYQRGAFTEPDMTYEKMESFIKTQMNKMNLPVDTIQKAVDNLPYLKRWHKVKA